MDIKQTDTLITLPSEQLSYPNIDSEDNSSLSSQIKLLTDTIEGLNDKIYFLREHVERLSSTEIKAHLEEFPNIQTLS